MPATGRKPKPPGQAVTRHAGTFEWADVIDEPYRGPWPTLPARRPTTVGTEVVQVPIQALTRRWWKVVSRMPHCRLWRDSDWEFAVATALVADDFFAGRSAATELARRERVLGTTVDARRDLRIRYVKRASAEAPAVAEATVTQIDDYRDLLA